MNKDDYMKLPKERLAELLAEKDAKDEFAFSVLTIMVFILSVSHYSKDKE